MLQQACAAGLQLLPVSRLGWVWSCMCTAGFGPACVQPGRESTLLDCWVGQVVFHLPSTLFPPCIILTTQE